MRPPFCCVCAEAVDPQRPDSLLRFADYEPLPEGISGHPVGLDWFCARHAPIAAELTHLTLREAMDQMAAV